MYRWQISMWKDIQHHILLGNSKWEQQWDTTTPIGEVSVLAILNVDTCYDMDGPWKHHAKW